MLGIHSLQARPFQFRSADRFQYIIIYRQFVCRPLQRSILLQLTRLATQSLAVFEKGWVFRGDREAGEVVGEIPQCKLNTVWAELVLRCALLRKETSLPGTI